VAYDENNDDDGNLKLHFPCWGGCLKFCDVIYMCPSDINFESYFRVYWVSFSANDIYNRMPTFEGPLSLCGFAQDEPPTILLLHNKLISFFCFPAVASICHTK